MPTAGIISFLAFWLGGAGNGGSVSSGYRVATITKIYNRVGKVINN